MPDAAPMGPLLCLVSASCFGAMAIFGKLAYDNGVSTTSLLLVRFTLAGLLLGGVLLLRHRRAPRRVGPLPLGPMAAAVGLGAVGYAAQASLFFSALRLMDAAILSLILYTYPVMVTAASVLLGRDRLTVVRVAALAAASAGTTLVLLGAARGSFAPMGALLAFGSAVVYTTYILVADRVVHRLPPIQLSALVMAGAAATFGVAGAVQGGVDLGFGWQGWLWLACIAVISTVLAVLTFFAGLRRTSPSTAAIASTFEPVVTVGLAALVLGEGLGPTQLIGAGAVLFAVVLLQLPGRARSGAGGRGGDQRADDHVHEAGLRVHQGGGAPRGGGDGRQGGHVRVRA